MVLRNKIILIYGYERVPFGITYKILNCSLHIFCSWKYDQKAIDCFFLIFGNKIQGENSCKEDYEIHITSGK